MVEGVKRIDGAPFAVDLRGWHPDSRLDPRSAGDLLKFDRNAPVEAVVVQPHCSSHKRSPAIEGDLKGGGSSAKSLAPPLNLFSNEITGQHGTNEHTNEAEREWCKKYDEWSLCRKHEASIHAREFATFSLQERRWQLIHNEVNAIEFL